MLITALGKNPAGKGGSVWLPGQPFVLRKESAKIRELQIRSRGLRLYAAWASGVSNVIQTRPEDWPEATLAEAAKTSIQETLLLNGRSHVS